MHDAMEEERKKWQSKLRKELAAKDRQIESLEDQLRHSTSLEIKKLKRGTYDTWEQERALVAQGNEQGQGEGQRQGTLRRVVTCARGVIGVSPRQGRGQGHLSGQGRLGGLLRTEISTATRPSRGWVMFGLRRESGNSVCAH